MKKLLVFILLTVVFGFLLWTNYLYYVGMNVFPADADFILALMSGLSPIKVFFLYSIVIFLLFRNSFRNENIN